MKSIEELRNLKMEKVIFESWRPLLFTCRLGDTLYLGDCCILDNKETVWLLNDITKEDIIKLLLNEISLKDAITKGSERISVKADQGCYYIGYSENCWEENSKYLPEDETLDYDTEKIKDIINFYRGIL